MKLASFSAITMGSVLLVSCMFAPTTTTAASVGALGLPAAATGANVDETKVQQILFVNNQNPAASDSNPGTEAQPFLTVSQAAIVAQANNANGIGTKVYIEPGIYREAVSLPQTGNETDAPLIFEGTVRGSVILSGSDVWPASEWTQTGPYTYQHNWPYNWGLAQYPAGWAGNIVLQDIVRRREMVYVNGNNINQVLQYSDLTNYTFFADDTAHTLTLQLGPNLPMSGSTIEVATRPTVMVVAGKTNLVMRDLVFRHGNVAVQNASIQVMNSNNVLIEGCIFEWNNWNGLGLSSTSNITLSGNTADHNGAEGIDVYNMKNVVIDSNQTSYNNWRGARGNYYGWSVAGAKLGGVHVGRVSNHVAAANWSRGLWLDYDNRDFTVDSVTLASNFNDGIFIEADPGPILIQNSTISTNLGASGIAGANSSDVTIRNNAIIGNGAEQVLITGDLDRTVVNWETGVAQDVQDTRWTMQANSITCQDSRQVMLVVARNWPPFLTTLSASGNVWSKPGGQHMFQVGSMWLSFPQWQTVVNADWTSVERIPALTDGGVGPLRRFR